MPQMRDHAGRFTRLSDGLVNVASGAGTSVDKRTYAFYTRPYMLPEQIENAFRSSWMMKKGIKLPAKDMTRKGRDWQVDEDTVDLIEKEEKRLKVWAKIRQALILGRLGGGLIVMGIGNDDPTQPLGTSYGKGALRYLHVMNRWQVALGPMITDPADDNFGKPSYFEIRFGQGGTTKGGSVKIHPSRVIAFTGEQVPNLYGSSGADDWYWGDSLVLSTIDAVKNAEATINGFTSLVEEAKVDTVTIPGLINLVATAEGEALVTKRIQIANTMKSNHNTRILDGGKGKDSPGETWETRQIAWTGMPDMIRVEAAIVASAFDIPATRFLGKAPDGMNATGEGDESNYVAKIATDQDEVLRPALDQLDTVLLPSAGVSMTDEAWYDFPPLKEMSALDESTIFKNTMDAITALQATGAIPEEAFSKAFQHTASARGWLDGLDGALAEIPEDERFPNTEPVEADPNALDPAAEPTQPPRRAAANDRKRSRAIEGGGRQAEPPFLDGFNPDEPRGPDGKWLSGLIDFVSKALSSKGHASKSLGKVTHRNAELVKHHTGLDLSKHERVIESSDVRHVFNSHGNAEREHARGQLPIRKADFAKINQIVEHAHSVRLIGQPGSAKPQRLEYAAHIDGNEHRYVEELRGNKIVALKSLLKKA